MTARAIAWLGTAMTFGGLLFAMPALYVPGLGLLLLAALAAGWVALAASGASVEQSLERPMVVEGEPLGVVVRARPGRWPAPGGRLECGGMRVELGVGSRVPRESRVEHRFDRRGRHLAPAPVLELHDPLGLSRRRLSGAAHDVLVLPRTEHVRHVVAEGGGRSASRTLRGGAEENELDGLRPYRPGAAASRIHWPAVARLGDLVERRLVTEADATPLVVLDASAPMDDEALDMAVRAAGSLSRTLARSGGCRVLLPGDTRATTLDLPMREWPRLWARLAVVGPAAAPPRLAGAASATTLFWVTARAAGPRAHLVPSSGEAFVVGPAVAATGRPAFVVAGCEARRLRQRQELVA